MVERRTYQRPVDGLSGVLEPRSESIYRSTFLHHRRLWSQAAGRDLDQSERNELQFLTDLTLDRRFSLSGRTRFLGGTPYADKRACCQFNCAFCTVFTVYDVVDFTWLLMNGSGVGFEPKVGVLHGFNQRISVQVIPSTRGPNDKGTPENVEAYDREAGTWTIRVGDSAEAWARAVGKLFCNRVDSGIYKLVIDMREVRGPGGRIAGYGWISNGWERFAKVLVGIHKILNRRAGSLLDETDIVDACNYIGTCLTQTRKSAQLAAVPETSPVIRQFEAMKVNCFNTGEGQRQQSNNSTIFWDWPGSKRLTDLLQMNLLGADIGFINGRAAINRAPWWRGMNPCVEILLGAFCNLVEINTPSFRGEIGLLEEATYCAARANYRQTCVDLNDGVLQPVWDQSNKSLRLCGTSLTGLVQSDFLTDYQIRRLHDIAVHGAHSMADELGLPRAKAVTTVKPSGTISKVFGTTEREITEGVHRPLGRYIFNWIGFSKDDPILPVLLQAGYEAMPEGPGSVVVKFPVAYRDVEFTKDNNGNFVNQESATDQLARYLKWNRLWADHNVSATIYYDESEIPAIVAMLHAVWDRGDFISVAWLKRHQIGLKPADLGVRYLPQEVVGEADYLEYRKKLGPVEFDGVTGDAHFEVNSPECDTGACPVR